MPSFVVTTDNQQGSGIGTCVDATTIPTTKSPAASVLLAAGTSLYLAGSYEFADGFTTEIGDGATLEIG